MKILLSKDNGEFSLAASYMRAFKALGCEAESFAPDEDRLSWQKNRILNRVFEKPLIWTHNRKNLFPRLLAEKADVLWIAKGNWLLPEFLREFKKNRPETKLVCYNADNPITTFSRGGNRPWVTEAIPYYDVYCTYNRRLVEPLLKAGAKKVLHIPFGWDPWLHPQKDFSETELAPYRCDVSFIGNPDGERQKWLEAIICKVGRENAVFKIYGHWEKYRKGILASFIQNRAAMGTEFAKIVKASKISLNILRLQNENSHNMRTFEITGAGGCMVSQKSDEQESFFPDGKGAVYFNDPKDAADKIRELLNDEAKRSCIRQYAAAEVLKHTYLKRAQQLLEFLNT